MAEFCKECFIEKIAVPSDNITDEILIMSDTWEICEGCCEIKPVVVSVRQTPKLNSIPNTDLNKDCNDIASNGSKHKGFF